METQKIELTPEQKDVLASLSKETGEPVDALIDTALEDLQERIRTKRANETANGSDSKSTQDAGSQVFTEPDKPIWEKFIGVSI